MTKETVEKNFQESCALRDAFWAGIGKVDPDVMGHLVNPTFMGGPRWPSLRQAFVTVRTGASTLIASDGLSDPFDDPADEETKSYNGYGLEFYVETPGNLDPVISSWQFDVVWQMSQNAANTGNMQALLKQYRYLTTELYDVNVPKEFHNDDGRVGVLLGLSSKTVPSSVTLSLETIDIINVKLLTLKELEYVVKCGKEGRDELAALLMAGSNPTYSDLSRLSVV